MRALSKFFSPLRQAAEVFFKHDLALRRDAAGLQIVLEARPPTPKEPGKKAKSGKPASAQREQEVQALMLEQLSALLAEVPSTRSALRHLGFVEQALRRKGLRALDRLPLEVLQRALEQLESLVTNWSPVGLASLRSKMAVAIIDREQLAPEQQVEAEAETNESRVEQAEIDALSLCEQEANEDSQALTAAYAALSPMASTADIEFQVELGSPSSKASASRAAYTPEAEGELRLRALEA